MARLLAAEPGMPLPARLRQLLTGAAGADRNEIRVHRDSRTAAAIGARGVAADGHIGFAPGEFRPGTVQGLRLIGHEVAHVLQQRRIGGPAPESQLEIEAERAGTSLADGGFADSLSAAPPAPLYQRQGASAPSPPQRAEPDDPLWFERAAAFTSGLDAIAEALGRVRAEVEQQQSEWYVFSDRPLTRPVIRRVLNEAAAYRSHVSDFLREAADDPLAAQLRSALATFDARVSELTAAQPADIGAVEASARRIVGGVEGAAGSFLGFLRLGLWDSWGQFCFDGSRQRINEAQDGMFAMMTDIADKGLGATISQSAGRWSERLQQQEFQQHYTGSGSQFGEAAMNVYWVGRSLASGVRGVAQLSRAAAAFQALGSPAPWRAAAVMAAREAATFRGFGVYGEMTQSALPAFPGRSLLGSSFGIPQAGPTVPIIRVIRSQQDLVAKLFREPNSMVMDASGRFRPLADIVRQHVSSSSPGSPLQSAFPVGDVETMLSGAPQNFGIAGSTGPYYVVLEVPRGATLIDVNQAVVAQEGLDPAVFPELQQGRFGLRLPEGLRPGTAGGYELEQFSPEARAWITENLGFGPGSAEAQAALEGIPYGEWEQLVVAPDLRPYVSGVYPNPFFRAPAAPIELPARGYAFYDPATNPGAAFRTVAGAPSAELGWGSFERYLGFLRSNPGLGFSSQQISGFQRMTMLGGRPLYLPVTGPAALLPTAAGGTMTGYGAWLQSAAPASSLLGQVVQSAAPGPATPTSGSAATVAHEFSSVAAQVTRAGARVTAFLLDPETVYLEAHATAAFKIGAVLAAVGQGIAPAPHGIRAAFKLVIDQPASTIDAAAARSELLATPLPPWLRVSVESADGTVLSASAW